MHKGRAGTVKDTDLIDWQTHRYSEGIITKALWCCWLAVAIAAFCCTESYFFRNHLHWLISWSVACLCLITRIMSLDHVGTSAARCTNIASAKITMHQILCLHHRLSQPTVACMMQRQHDAIHNVRNQATYLVCACWLSRLTLTADLTAAVSRLLPDVIAAAKREPDAEALAKAGAVRSQVINDLSCMLFVTLALST